MNTKSRQLLSLAAFVAYLGFLNVLVAHSHPVMLVFCHLLINRNSDRGLEESHIESSRATREGSNPDGMYCICFCFVFFVLFCFLVFRLSNGNLETRNIRWAALSPKLKKKKTKANRIAFPGKVHCLFLNSVLFLFNQVSSCVYPSVPTTRIQGLKFFVYCICNIMWHPLLNSWRFHSEKV